MRVFFGLTESFGDGTVISLEDEHASDDLSSFSSVEKPSFHKMMNNIEQNRRVFGTPMVKLLSGRLNHHLSFNEHIVSLVAMNKFQKGRTSASIGSLGYPERMNSR